MKSFVKDFVYVLLLSISQTFVLAICDIESKTNPYKYWGLLLFIVSCSWFNTAIYKWYKSKDFTPILKSAGQKIKNAWLWLKSKLFLMFFCITVAFLLIFGAAEGLSARSHPKPYKGQNKAKIEFQKRHDACVKEQRRIQARYIRR